MCWFDLALSVLLRGLGRLLANPILKRPVLLLLLCRPRRPLFAKVYRIYKIFYRAE